ncbi:MAG: FecR domain-containing protein [Bacteroidales bacterium]|nr:FecR domain-containing protein [Bacteroidales bacterium]MCF8334278.1 FecR domain-containing protein [Bacteroidales bacterium]
MKDELIIAYILNELGKDEQARVEGWITASDENTRYYHQLRDAWVKAMMANDYKYSFFNTTKGWEEFLSRVKAHKKRHIIRRRLTYVSGIAAAAAVVLFGVFSLLKPDHQEYKAYSASGIEEIELPDGSEVTLNKDGKVKYPDNFLGDTREITIFGEGFFEVETDEKHPFIVKAGQFRVEVLGTSFNVKQTGQSSYEVYVKEGSVLVYEQGNRSEGKKLLPGDLVSLESGFSQQLKTVGRNYLSWKTKELVFANTPLKKVVSDLEEYYGVDITIEDASLKEERLTTRFKDKPVEEALKVIELIFNVNAEKKKNNHIVLRTNSPPDNE